MQLDESLVLEDLGVSAYSGDNASRGALSGFLAAAESGRIQRGSILLVESLDRLSRTAIPEAVGLLTAIVRAGVRVVSLIDGHEWNEKTIEDSTSFLLSVLLFSRAHEESSTKARRVSEQFQKKRSAGLAVVSKGHGPGWAVPRADRTGWDTDWTRAEVVVRIFELAAQGHGGIAIARMANEGNWVLPWRKRKNTSTRWEHTGVSRLLRDRRVLGEWQPMRMIRGKMTPDGDPLRNYFPQVVNSELWFRVQAVLGARQGPARIRGIKADIFSGLFFCSCGERMDRKAASGRGYARYYCLGRKNGSTKCSPVAERVLVEKVLSAIAQLEQSAFNPDEPAEKAREEIAANEAKLTDIERRANLMLDSLENSGNSPFILSRLKSIEAERVAAEVCIHRAKAVLAAAPVLDRDFGSRLAAESANIINQKSEVEARQRVAQSLWQVVNRIVWNGRFFMIHTRGSAVLSVNPGKGSLARAKNRSAGRKRGAPLDN